MSSDVPWRLVPFAEAHTTHPGAPQRARGIFGHLLDRLRSDGGGEDAAPPEERLHALEARRLDALVPDPPIDLQRAALHVARAERDRLVILRPDDGSWDAALDEARPIEAPGPEAPAERPVDTPLPREVRERIDDPAPLHLPRLERWYLRHHDGIGALRELLAELGTREGPWSLDVSAWAWAWMRRVLPEARPLPAPHVAAPLDGEAVAAWIDPPDTVRLRGRGTGPDEDVFRALAARARGEAGVAAAIWRACLRDGAEEAVAEDGAEDGPAAPAVWMRHPSRVGLPDTAGLDRDDLIVLHAVLLHGAADAPTLRRALPFGDGVAASAAAAMTSRSLLERDAAGCWRVRPEALPAVRARLQAEAFATGVA